MAKSALFWGTPGGPYYQKEAIIVDGHEDYPFPEIIEDFIKDFNGNGKYLLGLPDPFLIIPSEHPEKFTIDDACKEGVPKTIFPTLMYFVSMYNVSDRNFVVGDINTFCTIVNACCGYEGKTRKIIMRLESGIHERLSSLGRGGLGKYLRCILRTYVLNAYLRIGGLTETVFKKIGPFIINGTDCDMLISNDKASLSCFDYIKHPKIEATGKARHVGYNIDCGLVLGLQELAKEKKTSVTQEFKNALFSNRWGVPVSL